MQHLELCPPSRGPMSKQAPCLRFEAGRQLQRQSAKAHKSVDGSARRKRTLKTGGQRGQWAPAMICFGSGNFFDGPLSQCKILNAEWLAEFLLCSAFQEPFARPKVARPIFGLHMPDVAASRRKSVSDSSNNPRLSETLNFALTSL